MFAKPVKKAKSEKAKNAESVILTGRFGCNTSAVADLVSAILGESVSSKKSVGVVTGAFAVPTKHGGNHNYKVGKAFFIPANVQLNFIPRKGFRQPLKLADDIK